MLINELSKLWNESEKPFFISGKRKLFFEDYKSINLEELNILKSGDVVVLIGDFSPESKNGFGVFLL